MEGTKKYRPGFTDQFSIQIKAPQGIRGIHPPTIAVRLNLALHEIMAHDFPGVEQASIRCGVMRAGLAANALPEEGCAAEGHKDNVIFNEDVLPVGAEIYANVAYRWPQDQA